MNGTGLTRRGSSHGIRLCVNLLEREGRCREAQSERNRPGVSVFQCRQTGEFPRREVAVDSLAQSLRSTPHPLFRDFERWSPAEIESFLRLAKYALSIQPEQPARTPRPAPLGFPTMQSKSVGSPVKRFPFDPRIRRSFAASIVPCNPRGGHRRTSKTVRDTSPRSTRGLAIRQHSNRGSQPIGKLPQCCEHDCGGELGHWEDLGGGPPRLGGVHQKSRQLFHAVPHDSM